MKILLAEDDAATAWMLCGLLEKLGHEVIHVSSGDHALYAMQQPEAPALAILDWMMPAVSGLEVCRHLKSIPQRSPLYVLMLTARDSTEDVVAGLEAGANDYLRKPFDWRELRARVAVAERSIRLLDDLGARAATDELTSLLNRRGILERLQQQLSIMRRTGMPVSVIILDVDHFKQINDSAGHAVGDRVLVALAGCMKSAIRCYDDVGRYGGEEFLAVLPDCDSAGAEIVAQRIREAVSGRSLPQGGGLRRPVTVSAGLATARVDAGESAVALIARADRALYEAKAGGRNRVVAAEPL